MDLDDFRPELIYPYDPRLTPHSPPTVDVCAGPVVTVCMNAEWWAHVSGMIARLTYRDAWVGTDDEISDAIESIYQILDVGRPSMSCGCGGTSGILTQVTPGGIFQVSYDGGITWIDAPELDPRNFSTLPPPISGDDGDDKRCKAANNVVRQMKDARAKFSNELETGKTIVDLAIVIAGAIAGVLFSGGALAPILIPIVVSLAAGIVNLLKADYDALFTPDVWDYALCQFYCGAGPDGSFTQAAFNTILTNFDSHFSGNLALTFSSTLNGWQLHGLNSAARIPSTDNLDCSACTDCPDCIGAWVVHPSYAYTGASIIDRGDDYITVQAGFDATFSRYDMHIYTGDNTVCCSVLKDVSGVEYLVGAIGDEYWQACGGDGETGFIGGGANQWINHLPDQWYLIGYSTVPFTVKIKFG